jgi:hypothetical protein
MLQAGRSGGSSPDEVIGLLFNISSNSSHTMVMGSTQPIRQMSTRNFPGGKERLTRKDDNLTAICEPIVYKMWETRRLTTLWAFTDCYRDTRSCTFSLLFNFAVPCYYSYLQYP